MSATVEVSYRQVLRNHRLALLLLGDVASRIGDGMIVVALPLQTLRIHDGMHPAVAIALIEAAPYAIAVPLSLFFGLGRTRFRPRTMVLADGILRLLTFTALGSLALVDALPLSVLGLALAAGSSLRLLAGSSRRLIATDLGGPRARFTVNALLGTSDNLAFYVAGPVLGGMLATLLAPGPVLLIDGLSFLPLLGVALLAIPAVTGHHAGIRGGLAVSALLTIALVSPATRALHTRRSP